MYLYVNVYVIVYLVTSINIIYICKRKWKAANIQKIQKNEKKIEILFMEEDNWLNWFSNIC